MIKKLKPRVQKLSNAIALVSAELFFVFTAFFVSLALLIIVIRKVFYHQEETFDDKVFSYLGQFVTDANTAFMQFVTVLGSHKFLIPGWLLLIAYYLFIRKNKWYAVKILTIGLSNLGLMFGLKYLFNRSRPLIPLLKEVPGLSFPSGHAYMSLAFFGLIIYLVYRQVYNIWLKWSVICALIILILLIGISRVYLRVHYASDVIAGYCFGILSLIILLWLLKKIEVYNAKTIPPHLNVTKPKEN